MTEPSKPRVTREEAIAAAGQVFAEGLRAAASMTVEEHARAAYTPTGPSMAELEQLIRAQRLVARPGLNPCDGGATDA